MCEQSYRRDLECHEDTSFGKWEMRFKDGEKKWPQSLSLSLSPPPHFFFLLAKREQINEEAEVTNDLQSSILRQQSGEFRQPFVRQSRNLITSPACLRNTESVTADFWERRNCGNLHDLKHDQFIFLPEAYVLHGSGNNRSTHS